MRTCICTAFSLLLCLPLFAQTGDETHSKKAIFADSSSWTATNPGQVTLANFEPFRAEYERKYTQGSGPNQGQPRVDRVVICADYAGWNGRKAINLTLWDTGAPEYADTNGRVFSQYFDSGSLQLLYEMGPIPGTALSYYTLRNTGEGWMSARIETDKGRVENKYFEFKMPGFGAPAPWVFGSLDLQEGKKIRLDPAISFGGGILTNYAPARVVEQVSHRAKDGRTYRAWVLESVNNVKNPWMIQTLVIARPPYLITRKSVNADTGEEKVYMELVKFHVFD